VSITAGGTTLTQITTIASSSPPIAVSSSQSQPGQFTNAGSLSASTNTSHFLDLIVELSLVSLIIAAGSMLFISRRLNSEKDAEV
jgi:hypothetical protein